jgi:hypothetical protein
MVADGETAKLPFIKIAHIYSEKSFEANWKICFVFRYNLLKYHFTLIFRAEQLQINGERQVRRKFMIVVCSLVGTLQMIGLPQNDHVTFIKDLENVWYDFPNYWMPYVSEGF